MENADLIEIRKNLAMLPSLQERIKILGDRIREAEENVKALLRKYEAESLDVEKLEKNSLSAILLKNFGRYEDRLTRESEEMLAAKLEYDKACARLDDLRKKREESEQRLSLLRQEEKKLGDELARRRKSVKSDAGSEVSQKYGALEAEQDSLAKELVETEEALRAARRVLSTAGSAVDQLERAENWATFDVWTRGGIFSHIAKYEHIDNAKDDFNRLNSQLEDLHRELRDLNLSGVTSLDGVDSGTRAVDFWFDNIFTDMNVRERIRDDKERVSELRDRISGVAYRLDNDISRIKNRLNELEQKKNDLLIGL
jgi:DNA repair exonuclease SbcCD ATPase subunit